MANVTVLGAGAWGTAFGQVLADAGNNVTMWAIEPESWKVFVTITTTVCACPAWKRCPAT